MTRAIPGNKEVGAGFGLANQNTDATQTLAINPANATIKLNNNQIRILVDTPSPNKKGFSNSAKFGILILNSSTEKMCWLHY
jgi:hypothetical protein